MSLKQQRKALETAARLAEIPTDETLIGFAESLLREWQLRLGLSRWTISLEIVDEKASLNMGEFLGFPERRTAHIKLLHPARYFKFKTANDHDGAWFFLFEQTLVHELVHGVMCPICNTFRTDTADEVLEENAVYDLTDAFMSLKYPGVVVSRETTWNVWVPNEWATRALPPLSPVQMAFHEERR